jgi:pyruvate dehydrogenase E2 component (dihydrolipoamide acetyltransferase)
VNQLIAVLAQEGEDPKAAAAAAGKSAPAPKAASSSPPDASLEKRPAGAPQDEAPKRPQAPAPSPRPEDGAKAPVSKDGGPSHGANRVFASPLARRMAKDAGIDVGRIQGSGPHGRIIARDVEAAKSGKALAPAAAAAAGASIATQPPSDDKIKALFEPGSYEVIPHDNIRKVIARRLLEAKTTIPHFYLTLDCNIGRLLAAREEINAAAPKDKDGKPAYKVSVNDFVIKALAVALQRVPDANVTWTEGGMLKHKHSDVGVAVSIPGGLITPVVRHAETKSLSVISNEMKDYATRARSRKLKPEEYQGGTSAVSNLGMYGVKDFAAVINPPHATILAVGAGEERVIVNKGKIEAAWIMSATLSTDHRAVDGALGAQLLGAFKALIENPVMMVV